MTEIVQIRSKDRDVLMQSLSAGVVPRRGQHLIQVGRAAEVGALLADVERIVDGGSTVRFVIGEYGSGKTFFLHIVRAIALEKKLVTVHGDLSPERRLYSASGHARSLYAELMRNMATRSKPEGGALASVVERFISSAQAEAEARKTTPDAVIAERTAQIQEMVGGYDFAAVIAAYWRGHDAGNEQLKQDAVRWLRAEFTSKTDAKKALGVRTIVDDETFYDHLKLMSRFVRLAGFDGLFVCLDEMVNLFKLAHTQARAQNYEQILRIVNDSLQGIAVGMGVIFCGTPEFLSDTRRGCFSYAALQSRLSENRFATEGRVDLKGPVVRLERLSPEDLYVLLGKIRHIYALGDPTKYLVPDDALRAFMQHCSERVGDAYFRTPRSTIREWVNLLAVLEQNPSANWPTLLGAVQIGTEDNPDLLPIETDAEVSDRGSSAAAPEKSRKVGTANDDDELTSFKLK